MRKLIDYIEDEYIGEFSYIILLLWIISPLIEYIFKNQYTKFYTYYFSFIIYIVGIIGILTYIVYLLKLKSKKQLQIKKNIPEILIIILLLISVTSTIFSKNPSLSLFGEGYRKEGLIVYVMYVGFLLLASILKDTKYIKRVIRNIILVALIITVFPLFNSRFTYVNFTNVFHNLNHYGYYLMINAMLSAFMFVDNKKLFNKLLYLLAYIFFTYLLIRNDTFGSYLAILVSLIFSLIYCLIKKNNRSDISIVFLVFIVTSFLVSNFDIKIGERINFESTKGSIARNFIFLKNDITGFVDKDEEVMNKAGSYRGILWKAALNYTLDHPLVGGGMECLKDYSTAKKVNDRPHNIVLQVSSFIGIPGAIIYLGLIIYIAISNLKILKGNTVYMVIYVTAMCYFISSMFGNSMYYTSPYFMILLGLLIGFIRRKEKTRLTK